MGISIRAYARHRGISDMAVRKAIKVGRISQLEDGTIDPKKADQEWQLNTEKRNQDTKPTTSYVKDTTFKNNIPSTSGSTFMQARTANEVIKAQVSKVKLKQLKGELIDKAEVIAHVFRLARQERDAWMSWPSRISAQMASELGVDPHKMHVMLEKYVSKQLEELKPPSFER
jgi:hypothetical protein